MRLLASALGGLVVCLVGQTYASSLEGTFNSPANISARARVQKPPRCPSSCESYDTSQWYVYPSTSRVAMCNETMLLDFMVYNPVNTSDGRNSIRSCVTNGSGMPEDALATTSCYSVSSQSDLSIRLDCGTLRAQQAPVVAPAMPQTCWKMSRHTWLETAGKLQSLHSRSLET